ncbi:MAG TPA: hypothetical protein VFI29_20005 [Hanamia sp.]|nr:hypothetical protein [Hanamia sp.]
MKNSYILLRNKKESNALSIEELQEIGLKKTDLIWVECQSMSWRSPFEIAELRTLISESSNDNIKNSPEKLVLKEVPNRVKLVKQQKAGETLTDPESKNSEKYSYPERVLFSGPDKKKIDIRSNNSSSPWGIINEERLFNAKQKALRNNKVFTFQLPERVKKIAFYTGLILTGALLMLLIQQFGNKREVAQQQEIPQLQPEKRPSTTATMPAALNKDSTITATNIETPVLTTEKGSVGTKKEQKKPVKPANNNPIITDPNSDTQDTSNNNNVGKNTPPMTELSVKPVSIEDISSKIVLKANDYKVGFFGGIRNLKLTLQNNSRYTLDKVTVELKYMNQNGKIINTEYLSFQNVKAGDAPDLEVNKSNRGVKVEYNISHIECKAITTHK